MANNSRIIIDDGILVWFEGPEWDDVAEEVFRDAANRVESLAQAQASWSDRTGDARAGLKAGVESDHGDIVLTLGHTVEYGLWLEVIQNGKFAIIMPTLEREAPGIITDAVRKIASSRSGRL